MTWNKLPALDAGEAGLRSGCLTCGPQPIELSADALIMVGFGLAGVSRDASAVWSEDAHTNEDDTWTCADAERVAARDPDHDWRIYYYGPLSEAVYQRHEQGRWVLVRKGIGFA